MSDRFENFNAETSRRQHATHDKNGFQRRNPGCTSAIGAREIGSAGRRHGAGTLGQRQQLCASPVGTSLATIATIAMARHGANELQRLARCRRFCGIRSGIGAWTRAGLAGERIHSCAEQNHLQRLPLTIRLGRVTACQARNGNGDHGSPLLRPARGWYEEYEFSLGRINSAAGDFDQQTSGWLQDKRFISVSLR